jgi:hypothetical protein
MSAPLIRCYEARPYLSAYVDGELDAGLAERIYEHLASCAECRRKVAKYRYVDELIGQLPTPGPSPEVLDRVLAATSSVNKERAVRQSLRRPEKPLAPRSLPAFILADTNLAAPVSARQAANQSRRGLVLARALPALAALLIIALALVSFHGRPGQTPSVRQSTPHYSPASQAELAEQKVYEDSAVSALGFDPVLPTIVPNGARFSSEKIHSMDTGQKYLDVAFTLSNQFTGIHLREMGVPLEARTDYVLQMPNALQTWQIPGFPQWQNMVDKGETGRLAVGEDRVKFSITLDIGQRGGGLYLTSPQAEPALDDLRITSLSMDSPYVSLDAISAPDASMVVHYRMQTTGTHDGKPYQWDVYWSESHREGSAALYTSTSSGALGTKMYTDYWNRDGVTRCTPYDRCENLPLSSSEVTHDPFVVSDQVRTFLNTGINGYVFDGELWNLGASQTAPTWPGIGTMVGLGIGTAALYVLAYVSGPYPIWVYVNTVTLQVVAVISQINLADTIAPGGKDAQSPLSSFGGCAVSYPLLVYLDPQSTALPDLHAPASLGNPNIATVLTCSP